MSWKDITIKLLIPFAIVFALCLYAVKALGQMIMCDCFISKFGTMAVSVVGLLSLVSSVPIILAIKKGWKSAYTVLIFFLFISMVVLSLLIGEMFYAKYLSNFYIK